MIFISAAVPWLINSLAVMKTARTRGRTISPMSSGRISPNERPWKTMATAVPAKASREDANERLPQAAGGRQPNPQAHALRQTDQPQVDVTLHGGRQCCHPFRRSGYPARACRGDYCKSFPIMATASLAGNTLPGATPAATAGVLGIGQSVRRGGSSVSRRRGEAAASAC